MLKVTVIVIWVMFMYFPHLPHSLSVSCEESRACGKVKWWLDVGSKEPSPVEQRGISLRKKYNRGVCVSSSHKELPCSASSSPKSHQFPLFVALCGKAAERGDGDCGTALGPSSKLFCLWSQEMLTGAETPNPERSKGAPAPLAWLKQQDTDTSPLTLHNTCWVLLGERLFSIMASSLHGTGNNFHVRVAPAAQNNQ